MVRIYVVLGCPWLVYCVSGESLFSRAAAVDVIFVDRRKRYALRPRSPLATARPEQVEGVSIIRPLKGLDANLFENLESTFTQEYPKFEILLSVAHPSDQAANVVRDLMAKYPNVDAKLVIGVLYVIRLTSG